MAFDSKGLDDYIDVAQRVAEFRVKHPEGSLQPLNPEQPFEVRELAGADKNGKEVRGTFIIYTAAAYRTPDDPRPGVGCAYEVFPGRTPYTAGSELQNAETAAWGRAIVAALAADTRAGVSSQQEVRNRQAERGQSAGDAFEDAAPPPPPRQQQQRPRAVPSAPRPAEAVAPSDDRPWLTQAIERAAALRSEHAGTKLWQETAARARAGEITAKDAETLQGLISARVEDLREKAFQVAMQHLSENESWRPKLEELSDVEQARAALEELGKLVADGKVDMTRGNRISQAIAAKFPRATDREQVAS